MTLTRRRALEELYALLAVQTQAVGAPRRLADCSGKDGWPDQGVYFFHEPGEFREEGTTPRIVRVGTHRLTERSTTTLWTRLRAHRGSLGGRSPGGGNHRGSVFRLHIGTALIARDDYPEAAETWGKGPTAPRAVRDLEVDLERAVSQYIGSMHVLWIAVPDRADRAAVERGCISLLTNMNREPIDPPSKTWLGHLADRATIRASGLWNVHHVDAQPDLDVLELLRSLVTPAA